MTPLNTNWIDWSIFGLYILAVFVFGLYMSRKEETTADFFLAGRRLPWYAIALSMFATNISAGSLVGLAGDAYRVGIAVGTLEWGAVLGLFMLTFIFLPYYQRRGVYTLPEFMEQRYNLPVRLIFAVSVLVYEILIYIPFLLLGGAIVMDVMFGIPFLWGLIGIAAFVGAYTILGGLGAVVWTDVIQGSLMILGGAVLTILGLIEIGGVERLMTEAADKMHVWLPADHPDYPFPGTLIGGYFLVTIYYWCLNQTMVQRALGARTEWDARMGAMVACMIKVILPFILVLPGIIAFVLLPDLERPDQALPELINRVVPMGLSGLLTAAILAALMSSADSSLNSWATLFTYDLYHRLLDKGAATRRLILVGRLAILCLLIVVVARAFVLRGTASILQYLLNGLAYLAGPIVIIFTVGVFWRRATSTAAIATIVLSPLVCYYCQHMHQTFGFGPTQSSIVYWLPIAMGVLLAVMVSISLITRPQTEAQLEGLIWARQDTLTLDDRLLERLDVENGNQAAVIPSSLPVWKDHRIVGTIAMLLMLAALWWLR